MNRFRASGILACLAAGLILLAGGQAGARDPVTPRPRAHAHNDYEHARPLLDALDQGFCSVEADIHLVNGQLLVAHDRNEVKPGRTLQALYLDPLRQRVEQHGGAVYPDGPGFTLMIDIKSDARKTHAVLEEVLRPYRDMLTEYQDKRIARRAVTVILSGNRPTATVRERAKRWVAIDGRLPDLKSNPPAALVPLVSDNWRRHFSWRGTGSFPERERDKLRGLVKQAHDQRRRIRFWAVPDHAASWAILHEAGVDLINTDRLEALAAFLEGRKGEGKAQD